MIPSGSMVSPCVYHLLMAVAFLEVCIVGGLRGGKDAEGFAVGLVVVPFLWLLGGLRLDFEMRGDRRGRAADRIWLFRLQPAAALFICAFVGVQGMLVFRTEVWTQASGVLIEAWVVLVVIGLFRQHQRAFGAE